MNTLSWFLYFADIASKVSILFAAVAGAGALFCVISFFVMKTQANEALIKSRHYKMDTSFQEEYQDYSRWANQYAIGFSVLVFLLVVSFLVPSKDTIYMIAASEMGEHVAMSSEALEIGQELKAAVLHQLKLLQEEVN